MVVSSLSIDNTIGRPISIHGLYQERIGLRDDDASSGRRKKRPIVLT